MKWGDFKDLKILNPDTLTVYGEPAFVKYEGIDKKLAVILDDFIIHLLDSGARSFRIHDFNTRTHDGKDHPAGRAVDISFTGIALGRQVVAALMWGWPKIGFYPEWNNPGLHLSITERKSPLVWYGFYTQVNGQRVQRYAYSSSNPRDVMRTIFDLGEV